MNWTDLFSSKDCPAWFNVVTMVLAVGFAIQQWLKPPSHEAMAWFGFAVFVFTANMHYAFEKVNKESR